MKNSNPIINFFFGNKIKILFITLPLLMLTIGTILFWFYYQSAYKKWDNDKEIHISTLVNYYREIDRKVNPVHYKKPIYSKLTVDSNSHRVNFTTFIYDIKGRRIGRFSLEDRSMIGLKNVSNNFIDAVLATEDRGFYHHNGISYKSLLRAILLNIKKLRLHQGGSTITQQLAKVLIRMELRKRERTIERKLYELFMAKEIERLYGKNDILMMYINKIFFGHNVYGIEEASKFYFNKSAKKLSIGESALLAGLIANPSAFSPIKNYENAKARHLRVLEGIAKFTKLDKDYKIIHSEFWKNHDFKNKKNRKVFVRFKRAPSVGYVIEEVRREMIQKLKKMFNGDVQKAANLLYTKGWHITTSIDIDIQRIAKKQLKMGLLNYRKKIKGLKRLRGSLNKVQGAIVVLDPSNGHIKAFVGGEEFKRNNQFNRVYQAYRQPGSAFKPITYLAALERRANSRHITPYTMVKDSFEPIEMQNGTLWKVRNYRNHYTNKYLNLYKALKISSNQVAARLIKEIGVEKIREIVRRSLGWDEQTAIKKLPDGQYSIALGSVEMTPLEIAQLYAMIANKGVAIKPKLILGIKDVVGETIVLGDDSQSSDNNNIRVVSKESAYQITDMMRGVLEPGGTGGQIKKLAGIKFDIAGKTGTSQEHRDMWFAGFTPQMATVVWIGHDQNKSLSGGGGSVAGPIFGRFMKKVSQKIKFTQFNYDKSYNLRKIKVCRDSGKVAVEGRCTNIDYYAVFKIGREPRDYCELEHNDSIDRAEQLFNPETDKHHIDYTISKDKKSPVTNNSDFDDHESKKNDKLIPKIDDNETSLIDLESRKKTDGGDIKKTHPMFLEEEELKEKN